MQVTSLSSVSSTSSIYSLVAQREQTGELLRRSGESSTSDTTSTPTSDTASTEDTANNKTAAADASTSTDKAKAAVRPELTPDQQKQIERLKEIDAKVHAHEQAHIAAGGGLVTGGANYSYTYGPDGKPYANYGEVGIDTSAEKEPADNITKGQRIRTAAMAPSDPSATDYRVASVGNELSAKGRIDLNAQKSAQQAAERAAAIAQREGKQAEAAKTEPVSTDVTAAAEIQATTTPIQVGQTEAANVTTPSPQPITLAYSASGARLGNSANSTFSTYA